MINKPKAAGFFSDYYLPSTAAQSAHYDSRSHRIIVHLRNGASFLFPPNIVQGLSDASPNDLARVKIAPSGEALHWETLDVDLSIPALMMGIFGTKAWMRSLISEELVNIEP